MLVVVIVMVAAVFVVTPAVMIVVRITSGRKSQFILDEFHEIVGGEISVVAGNPAIILGNIYGSNGRGQGRGHNVLYQEFIVVGDGRIARRRILNAIHDITIIGFVLFFSFFFRIILVGLILLLVVVVIFIIIQIKDVFQFERFMARSTILLLLLLLLLLLSMKCLKRLQNLLLHNSIVFFRE